MESHTDKTESKMPNGVLRSILGAMICFILLIIFMAGLSAMFNGVAGVITAYVYEVITGMKKENGENNSIDFEIK